MQTTTFEQWLRRNRYIRFSKSRKWFFFACLVIFFIALNEITNDIFFFGNNENKLLPDSFQEASTDKSLLGTTPTTTTTTTTTTTENEDNEGEGGGGHTIHNDDSKDSSSSISSSILDTHDDDDDDDEAAQAQHNNNNNNNKEEEEGAFENDVVSELLEKLQLAREKVEDRVRLDYGKYFDLFFSSSALSQLVGIKEKSMEVLVDLLHSKIISAQLDSNSKTTTTKTTATTTTSRTTRTTFVWSTGGHSAAAGHGNLFSQAYTAILEDTVKEAFKSLDIHFIGRNHAMGGYKSGPELACCMSTIYGTDTDILSWDFGMTDGWDTTNLVLWTHRASILKEKQEEEDEEDEEEEEGLPFLFYMNGPRDISYDDDNEEEEDVYAEFEGNGLGLAWLDTKKRINYTMALPDFQNSFIDDPDDIPIAVKYFKCGDNVETENTVCGEMKWNTTICGPNRQQTSWHPGWKSHMLNGRILGFFLLDILTKAVEMLNTSQTEISDNDSHKPEISLDYMNHLTSKQKLAREQFTQTPLPTAKFGNENHTLSNTILYRSESICHSALLPSMSRYNNFLHPSRLSESIGLSDLNLDLPQSNNNGTTPLYMIYDTFELEQCEVLLKIDYKDRFLARFEDGLVYARLPSGTEIPSDENDLYLPERIGVIMICQPECPWDECDEGSLQLSSLNDNNKKKSTQIISLTVNSKEVKSVQKLSNYCYLLENSDGNLEWGAGTQYDLTFTVNEPGTFIQMSSIVIW